MVDIAAKQSPPCHNNRESIMNQPTLKLDVVDSCCSDAKCCPPASTGRRGFIKATGLSAAMLLAGRSGVMAGPFADSELDHPIPADKKLSKQWIESLYARGNPMTATGDDLKYIGMPINGVCTGQVYLGGDGRLWRWNLDGARDFKKETPKGPRFLEPDVAASSMSQGFALQVGGVGSKKTHTLDENGFANVTFTNHYPMATVDYVDPECPVSVKLEACTPFIPLNRDDSSFPVIVMRYTIANTSESEQEVAIAGWIENVSNRKSGAKAKGKKHCVYRELDGISTVECFANLDNAKLKRSADHGNIALGLLGDDRPTIVDIDRGQPGADGIFDAETNELEHRQVSTQDFARRGFAAMGQTLSLPPGESQTVTFTLSWRFPNVEYSRVFGRKTSLGVNHYATQFSTAADAARTVAAKEEQLLGATQAWTDTWYDSTLPYWFLERTFVTLNCVQTQTGQRLAKGQEPEHYNFDEGVKCCPGNCTHVWHYAQGLSRIFPQIERENRDKVEYGLGFDPKTGSIRFRYTDPKFGDAIDGNCGTILRVLRESQMTADHTFLQRLWDRTRLSMDHVIAKWDPDEDGLLEGSQHNTLDEPWFGQVHWLINLYHAALKASAVMARQMNEPNVARRYDAIVAKGVPGMVDLLWNDDFGYFIHKPGPGKDEGHGSTNGCHIDQILGDSWLWNLGIEGVLPKDKVRQTLESLWKYNFAPDVGLFREKMTDGRWYAAAGNAGLIMCSFPYGKVEPKSGKKSYAGYLNECMTGFEWQVAAHMIWEGMVEKGLAIGKAIYDRYLPQDRNPYNEIECSDHYSRAMASYGAYLAICGYRYDGPQQKLAFGPRLAPNRFRAAFTTAAGWGSFSQTAGDAKQTAAIDLRYGTLDLKELSLDRVEGTMANQVNVVVDGDPLSTSFQQIENRYVIEFDPSVRLDAGQKMEIHIT
ncbi:Glucosylceramidase domain protein [Rhodopirellula sp. SWK7]|nr:Glucosylceramidase domain protein [Rhodopirellula sp. SWK7]